MCTRDAKILFCEIVWGAIQLQKYSKTDKIAQFLWLTFTI